MWKLPESVRIQLFFDADESVLFVQNSGKLLHLQDWAGEILQWMSVNPGFHESEQLRLQLSSNWQNVLTAKDIDNFMKQLMIDGLMLSSDS